MKVNNDYACDVKSTHVRVLKFYVRDVHDTHVRDVNDTHVGFHVHVRYMHMVVTNIIRQ